MRKLIVATLAFTMAAATANAVFFIQWDSSGGFSLNGADPLLPNVGDSMTTQLLFAPDGTPDDSVLPGGITGGDDVLLQTEVFSNVTGGQLEQYGFFSFVFDEDMPYQEPGSAYVRVFEPGAIEAGSMYAQSDLAQATDRNKEGVPPDGPNALKFFASGINTVDMAVVPEPTSLALILFGTMAVAVRHRRNRS